MSFNSNGMTVYFSQVFEEEFEGDTIMIEYDGTRLFDW